MPAPCGGCPPCCAQCVWEQSGETLVKNPDITVVMEDYGCVRGPSQVVKTRTGLGLLLNGFVHYLTDAGRKFLSETNNPLTKLA